MTPMVKQDSEGLRILSNKMYGFFDSKYFIMATMYCTIYYIVW